MDVLFWRFANPQRKLCALISTLGVLLGSELLSAGELYFGGFSEITARTTRTQNEFTKTFTQGGIDLYLTKTLAKKTNMLAEIVFEIGEDNEAFLDPERIWIQHEISPWFMVKAGRVHTALGHWNETYHHGTWLQTSISRPVFLEFEDDGGLLPVHNIGLELRGKGSVGVGEVGYIVDIGNGRGVNPDPPQSGQDSDSHKAVTGLVFYKIGGLKVGGLYRYDKIASSSDFDANADGVGGDVRNGFEETIVGVHVIWDHGGTLVIFEGFSINHDYETALIPTNPEGDNTIRAYYLQAGHTFGKWTPYARYEAVQGDDSNPDHYLNYAADLDRTRHVAGVRYDLTYTSALKLEYTRDKDTGEDPVTGYSLNWSYAW